MADNEALGPDGRRAVVQVLQPCMKVAPAGATSTIWATVPITTGPSGMVTAVRLMSTSEGGAAAAFGQIALDAAADTRCAVLPSPPAMLGREHNFQINFPP